MTVGRLLCSFGLFCAPCQWLVPNKVDHLAESVHSSGQNEVHGPAARRSTFTPSVVLFFPLNSGRIRHKKKKLGRPRRRREKNVFCLKCVGCCQIALFSFISLNLKSVGFVAQKRERMKKVGTLSLVIIGENSRVKGCDDSYSNLGKMAADEWKVYRRLCVLLVYTLLFFPRLSRQSRLSRPCSLINCIWPPRGVPIWFTLCHGFGSMNGLF